MSKPASVARSSHDHAGCIRRAVSSAERLCEEKQIRLTPMRKRVLEIIWRAHEPIGAYDILAEIAKDHEKAAPPTVYRALEFLQDAGLVHRVDSLNAFLGCDRPESPHASQFLVCSKCRRTSEIQDAELTRVLSQRAEALGYRLEGSAVEIKALCTECAQAA
jgi:Fur family transcriptional regulator, zinc uptake regulator